MVPQTICLNALDLRHGSRVIGPGLCRWRTHELWPQPSPGLGSFLFVASQIREGDDDDKGLSLALEQTRPPRSAGFFVADRLALVYNGIGLADAPRWRMYRHAFYTRKSSDGWSEEEDEFGRIDFKTREELIAAGVPQPADLEFVERSKREILSLVKNGSACCGPIARQLNAKGILNNAGGDWTDRIVKIFADRYLQVLVRY